MIVYKKIDQYNSNTGEKVGTRKVFDFYICDFTGEKINQYSNPNTYIVNYNSNDPCAGDGEGESWFWEKNFNDEIDAHTLFLQSEYIFKTTGIGMEIFGIMIHSAQRQMKGAIYSLDHLLRWSRAQMLEKILEAGTYKIEQFLEEEYED